MNRDIQVALDKYVGGDGYDALCFDNDDGLPCHTTRISVDDDFNLNSIHRVRQFIKLARQLHDRGQVMFSITERDADYDIWLHIARKATKSAQIVETHTRHHVGNYKCWMIFYQCTGVLPKKVKK